jgi:hypothetical protein
MVAIIKTARNICPLNWGVGPMLDKLDDIIKRFVAVFLFPLINMLIMVSITYFATSTDKVKMSSKVSDFLTNILRASADFIQTNLATISSALHDYHGTFETLTSASAAASLFIFVLTIYLIDRAVYYVGFFFPPNFEFDHKSYAAKASEGRSAALKKIFTTNCEVAKCYGAIRAYLGDKNTDQYRLNQRNKYVSRIEAARTVLAYTKAYIFYLLIVFVWSGGSSWIWSSIVLVFLLVVWGLTVGYLSFEYRTLVEYDLDSFIWERSYSAEKTPNIDATLLLSDVGKPPYRWEPEFFREWLYLKVVLVDAEA